MVLTENGDVGFAQIEGGIDPAWAVPTVLRKAAAMIEAQLLQ